MDYIVENANDDLLIVEDVFDSGHSVVALKEKSQEVMHLKMPRYVRIATPYYKPKNKAVLYKPLHNSFYPHFSKLFSLGKTPLVLVSFLNWPVQLLLRSWYELPSEYTLDT